jgi:hypothetical protein
MAAGGRGWAGLRLQALPAAGSGPAPPSGNPDVTRSCPSFRPPNECLCVQSRMELINTLMQANGRGDEPSRQSTTRLLSRTIFI